MTGKTIVRGTSLAFARQTPRTDGTFYSPTSPSGFSATITPVASLYRGTDPEVVASPEAFWVDADSLTWGVKFVDSDTSSLVSGDYSLRVVYPVSDAETYVIGLVPVTLADLPGSDSDTASWVSVARVLGAIPNLSDAQKSRLTDLVAAACNAAERYCNRRFAAQDYDELYNGDGTTWMMLRNYPVNSMSRLGVNPVPAATVRNTDTATNQRASVTILSSWDGFGSCVGTGLQLVRVASGVKSTSTVTFTAGMTVSQLVAAVNALGNGWYAETSSPYAAWPVSEILPNTGSMGAIGAGSAKLNVMATDMTDYTLNPLTGEIRLNSGYYDPVFTFGPYPLAWPNISFPIGTMLTRASYNAGYAVVPDDLQEAVIMIVQYALGFNATNPSLRREKLFDYEYEKFDASRMVDVIPPEAQAILNRYKDFRASGSY